VVVFAADTRGRADQFRFHPRGALIQVQECLFLRLIRAGAHIDFDFARAGVQIQVQKCLFLRLIRAGARTIFDFARAGALIQAQEWLFLRHHSPRTNKRFSSSACKLPISQTTLYVFRNW
jgi:hypothetical protein